MTKTEKITIHLLLNIIGGILLMMTKGNHELQLEEKLEEEFFKTVKKTTEVAKQLIEREENGKYN